MHDAQTEAQAIADLSAIRSPEFCAATGGNFAVLPQGYAVHSLEPYQVAPNRIEVSHTFVEVESLIRYLDRFGDKGTLVSVNFAAARIDAVIDGHVPGEEALPGWCKHRAAYRGSIDTRLDAWLALAGKQLSQTSFGQFLESRAADVVQPEAASVIDMVMSFEAVKKVAFRSASRLHDGQRQLVYVEENEARGAITVPDHFVLVLPVFTGAKPQQIKFWLRYRIIDGVLTFAVDMHDRDEVLRMAFTESVDALAGSVAGRFPRYVIG